MGQRRLCKEELLMLCIRNLEGSLGQVTNKY
jgi:hypothetical protein